jgi:hypothetical protein
MIVADASVCSVVTNLVRPNLPKFAEICRILSNFVEFYVLGSHRKNGFDFGMGGDIIWDGDTFHVFCFMARPEEERCEERVRV